MNKAALAILGMVAALMAGPAAAQTPEKGIYLGGSVGYSQYKDVCKNLLIPCDGNDTAWRLFGGYQFNRNWSLELGYADLGESEGAGPIPAGGNADFKWSSYALDLTGIGSVYLTERLALFGRLGAYMGRTEVDVAFSAFPASNSHDAKTNSGFTFGAGAAYTLGRVGLRVEWQRYDNIGTNSQGTDEVDVFSVGALFRF